MTANTLSLPLLACLIAMPALPTETTARPVARAGAVPPPAVATRPKAPANASDATIERDIRARFARSKIAADGFTVRVQSGVAIITGATNVIQHKGVATRMAKSGGALAVNNQVVISEAARQKAVRTLAAGRHRAQVTRTDAPERR